MRVRKPKERETADFNLTPMIDLMLCLIIFFMLTAQFARATLSEMDLPQEAGETAVKRSEHAIVIDLDKGGGLSLFGRRMDLEAVVREVRSEIQRAGEEKLELYIRADRTCAASHLNALALELARAGVRDWKMATTPPPGAVGGAP
jgi:biopolymer transport protein ExbD